MKKTQGEKILAELFNACDWKEKYKDAFPPDEEKVTYKWCAEDAELAMPFFSETGRKIMTEESCVAKRSLYLARDENDRLCLYIYEQEKESYRQGIPEMAKDFACMLKVDNIMKDKK
ncbi:MAG: hypothetical protein ACOCV7_02120 [Desulfonatronovibrionaceae bacterium]